jgi:hypothetical protein
LTFSPPRRRIATNERKGTYGNGHTARTSIILALTFTANTATIEFDDFKGFRIPAKHTIASGSFVLYDGMTVGGRSCG